MSFQLRKLASYSTPDSLQKICDDNGCNGSCGSPTCDEFCPHLCHSSSHSKLPTKYLIIISTLLTLLFLILCFYVYYVRCFKRRSSVTRRPQRDETTGTQDEFLDEDHGPVVDHHIWYINTVGLQPSVINSIAVCKYVKGEGLVDGTECSVCLTEFEEDETLRLLPKCSHAFHVPCIDTWLRAHTNCPMCRAPIVSNMTDKGPSSEVNTEGTRVTIMEDDEESVRETEGEDELLAVENEGNIGESSVQSVRRSFSLDSMAASEISQAPANNGSNLDSELDKGKESSLRIVSRRGVTGNQSLFRLMCHSSIGRSLQIRPIFTKRSFSCNGKFSLPISNNNENPTPN